MHDFPRIFTGNGCQKLSVKSLACSLWLNMSFKHCDVGLACKRSSLPFLRARHGEQRSKIIMQINGKKRGKIGVERKMTAEVLVCFELLFQRNGNS